MAAFQTSLQSRVPALDRTRGVAVLMMVAYHFCFDLDQYGLIHQDFNTEFGWLAFRALIVSLFMGALGASLALAHPGPIRTGAVVRRQLRLGLACLLVSAGSALMFPTSWIWFGILHFAWVASLIALPLRRVGWPLLVLAATVAWAGNYVAAKVFDQPGLGWIGFMTHKPITEDYVPIFPWFAAVLVGLYLAPELSRYKGSTRPGHSVTRTLAGPVTGSEVTAGAGTDSVAESETGADPVAALAGSPGKIQARAQQHDWRPGQRADRALRVLGSHTLAIYLAHQPVLLGLLELARRLG